MVGLDLKISYAGGKQEVVVISARGYIDATTSPEFSKLLEEQLALGKYKYVVNLQGVDFISSTGWGVFIGHLKEIRDNGGDIILTNMVPGVHNIFDLMEFSSIIKDYDSQNKAIAYFLGFEVRAETRKAGPSEVKLKTHEGILIKKEERPKQPPSKAPSKPAATTPLKKPELRAPAPTVKPSERPASIKPERVAPGPPSGRTVSPPHEKRAAPPTPPAAPGRTPPAKPAPPPAAPGRTPPAKPVARILPKKSQGLNEITIFNYARNELGRRILRVVSDYPYYDIKEIAKALRLPEYGWKKASVYAIKSELKKMGLLDKRIRYEFVTRQR